MKTIVLGLILILLINNDSKSQDLPSDYLILLKVFGKTDTNKETFSCKYSGDESIYSYQDSVVYRVAFKDNIKIDNRDLVISILTAPYGTQHGHQFGYMDIYFFENKNNNLKLIDSIKSDGVGPMGDSDEFEILDIGRNKKAIVFTFRSTGNHHYENTKHFNLLDLNNLTYLFTVYSEYDNSAWKVPAEETDDCEAERYEETYEIINNNSDWFDVKILHIDYGFTKGCKESYIIQKLVKKYVYLDGKYVPQNETP